MSYQPQAGDVATDLIRCFNASQGTQGFNSSTYKTFIKHANIVYSKISSQLPDTKRVIIQDSLDKIQNDSLEDYKRKEHLLLASNLLLHAK